MNENISTSTNKYDLFNFLDEHKIEKGKVHTHTSMGKPTGAFFIGNDKLDYFYELYEKALFNGHDLHITEKHEDFGPLIVDLDFKYENTITERQHTEEHVMKIVELYIAEICDIFDIDRDDPKLNCFVFEREQCYTFKNSTISITKDGIHFIFPHIICKPAEQHIIRDKLLKEKKIAQILSDIPIKNQISDVVDKAVIESSPWLLFGSKKPNCEPYKLTYIIDGNIEKLNIQEFDFCGESLVKYFSLRNKKESQLTHIKNEKLDLIEQFNIKKKPIKAKTSYKIDYDIEQIKDLIAILNPARADNYMDWIQLGWALHNIDINSQELLDIWIDFSKNSSKFQNGVCEKEWIKSKNDGLTVRSIHHWAKNDSPKEYEKIMDKDIRKLLISTSKDPTNYDIANVLYIMFKYEFKFTGSEWYIFKNHVWNRENDGYSLRMKISNDLARKYGYLLEENNNMIISNINMPEEEKEEYKKKNKQVLNIIKNLKTTSFKENIMKECKELFYDKEFVNKLDSNVFLVGFKNGIFDLESGILRSGNPDDYVELTTGIDKIEFSDTNEFWPDLQKFLNTVFVDEEVRFYFFTYLSSCLVGHNAEEKARFWTGVGCHAINTKISMYDGTLKNVEDIKLDEQLMGDDKTPRNVIEIKRGFGAMYKFFGYGFEEFIVNEDHILCLYRKSTNTLLQMSVYDYINMDITVSCDYYLYDKNLNKFDFMFSYVNEDFYYGFELDGNHCYEMGNGIITHNSNGKSKILELFVHAFGSYTIKFPITLLTGKRAASNACTPELVQAKGKRFAYCEEPSGGEKINSGLLKEITGGDKIKARGLHKEPIEFKPQFKLCILCNDIPELPAHDTGVWRRIEVIEFKSRFCENPKEDHEFMIDKMLSEKMKHWKELFMALLLDVYYAQYRVSKKIKVPKEVVKFTLEFQKQCDQYDEFIGENVVETKVMSDTIDIIEFYDEFKIWYEDTYSNHKYPSKIEFKNYLKKRYTSKRVSNKDVKGFKFKLKYDKSETEIPDSYEKANEIEENNSDEEEEKEVIPPISHFMTDKEIVLEPNDLKSNSNQDSIEKMNLDDQMLKNSGY